MALQSELLKGLKRVVHNFGVLDEGPLPDLKSCWANLPKWKQVHGVEMAKVSSPLQDCGQVDALYTSESQIPVAVITADCVPILMAHKDGKGVAAIHAGWRGTKALILEQVWKKLGHEGHQPGQWVAAVGPAIGPCCYQVGEDLAAEFQKDFGRFGVTQVVPSHRMLDLPRINFEVLKELGLAEVELLRYCTQCSVGPRFHSYRRSQGQSAGRQYSGLVIC